MLTERAVLTRDNPLTPAFEKVVNEAADEFWRCAVKYLKKKKQDDPSFALTLSAIWNAMLWVAAELECRGNQIIGQPDRVSAELLYTVYTNFYNESFKEIQAKEAEKCR